MRINQSELARNLDVSRQAVSKAVSEKRITRGEDGLFDLDEVTKEWNRKRQVHRPAKTVEPTAEQPSAERTLAEAEPSEINKDNALEIFNIAKAAREQANARTAQLDLKLRMRELIPADEARKTWHAIGRMYAQARENIPMQAVPMLAGKTDLNEMERILREHLREADARVANEIQSRFGDIVNGSSGAS